MVVTRSTWSNLTDAQLLKQCHTDTYRASGPGGQKRNKTSSAVRLRHVASGLTVIAEESRSQHENRVRALRRLRQALYLHIRDGISPEEMSQLPQRPEWRSIIGIRGRLDLGRRDSRFWPAVGLVLDVVVAVEAKISQAAVALGISTGNLVRFLQVEPKVWQQANQLRAHFGKKLLVS